MMEKSDTTPAAMPSQPAQVGQTRCHMNASHVAMIMAASPAAALAWMTQPASSAVWMSSGRARSPAHDQLSNMLFALIAPELRGKRNRAAFERGLELLHAGLEARRPA
jgi:hypothetical protein